MRNCDGDETADEVPNELIVYLKLLEDGKMRLAKAYREEHTELARYDLLVGVISGANSLRLPDDFNSRLLKILKEKWGF